MSKLKKFLFSKKLLQVLILLTLIGNSLSLLLNIISYMIMYGANDQETALIGLALLAYFGTNLITLCIIYPVQIISCIIMLNKIKKVDELKTIPIVWKVITFLFCSRIGGLLLLIQRDHTKPASESLITPLKKFILIALHAITVMMIWCVPCVQYGRLSWDGLEGSESTSLGSAIADFSSYDSSEASTLLVLLILVHVCAVLFLLFTCTGKHKPPMIIFSCCTVGFTCLLNLIANSYETIKITVSDSFWGASVAAYEIDDSVQFTVLFAIATLVVTFIMILRRSGTSVMSTIEDTPISATEPTPTSASDPTSVQTLEERLTQLNDLKARGLITEEEYNEKKQSILSEL